MNIDISRVNLLEKDVEDWLYENPDAIPYQHSDHYIKRWMGRQYSLPSGIADLVGLRDDDMVVVVEVKNVQINKAAILQVCRYAQDLKHVIDNRMSYPHRHDWGEPAIDTIVFGPSIDEQTLIEAESVGVNVVCFSASLVVNPWSPSLTRERRMANAEMREEISLRDEWGVFGLTAKEQVELDFGSGVDLPEEPQHADGYSNIILLGDGEGE